MKESFDLSVILIAFLTGFGLAVIVFVLAAWSVDREPKKKKKVFSSEVNRLLTPDPIDLDEHEMKITA